MSGTFFTGPRSNAAVVTKYTQMNIQTSALNIPIPLVWGKTRLGSNLIWYNDFKAVNLGGKKGGGGKGGGGKGAIEYEYYAAVILALCEGPITGIGTVWNNQSPVDSGALAFLGFTLFTGTASQAVWSYLTTNHPTQALSYSSTTCLANSNFDLGKSPTLPNLQYEVITPLSGSMPGTVDVNPADVLQDFLTNPQYSIGLLSAQINASDLTFWKTYCQAAGLFFSPSLQAQEQVASVLDRWAQITNSWIFWSGSSLRILPLGDTGITNNGVTYTPVTAVRFQFSYEDYVDDKSGLPVTVDRKDPADCPNFVRLEVLNRLANYDAATAYWKDDGLFNQYGEIDAPVTLAHEICDLTVGQIAAQLIGMRSAYIRNTYTFKLGWEFGSLLEPGDIVELNEPHINLVNFPVRLRTLDEDDHGEWTVVAEELPPRIGTAEGTTPAQPIVNSSPNVFVVPGNTNPPCIFEPNSSLTHGVPQLWIAASGGANWAGCFVNLSFDGGTTYYPYGTIGSPAAQGTLTADLPNHSDPDTADTLAIDTTESQVVLPTDAAHADADAFRTLCMVTAAYTSVVPNNGELLAYGTVTAGSGTYASNLTYLRRGLYGTTPADHPIGSFFTRINLNGLGPPTNNVFVYNLPPQYVGTTVHVKLVAFNKFGAEMQDISSVPAYSYTPTGAGYGGGAGGVPLTPTGLAATGGYNAAQLAWNSNAPTDNVQYYKIYRALGASQPFGSATQIATTNSPLYADAGLLPSQAYTYFIVAHNVIGDSAATAGVNVTTLAQAVNDYRLQGDFAGKPPSAQVLFYLGMKGGESFAAGLPGSLGGCSIAPTSTAVFTLLKNGVSVGTMTIAAAALTATFSFTGTVTFSAGDIFEFLAPSPQDSTMSTPYYTLLGTR